MAYGVHQDCGRDSQTHSSLRRLPTDRLSDRQNTMHSVSETPAMSDSIIFDFASIRQRQMEIVADEPIPDEPANYCSACENGGWTYYGIGHNDPHFRVCESCGNPEGYLSP